MIPITTLLVGDSHRGEFRQACQAIRAKSTVVAAADVDQAGTVLASGEFVPELIVIAQARPGEFSADQVDSLRRMAPLARVLGLLGSWCEGEVRTGHPWPGVARVYWYNWLTYWRQELQRVGRGECPAWGLPVTATGAERLLHTIDEPLGGRQGSIVVSTPCLETFEALTDACRARGYATVWVRPCAELPRVGGSAAAIWDAVDGNPREINELGRLCDMLGHLRVVALMDCTRTDSCHRVFAAGASSVVAKPYLLVDLFDRLDEVIRLRDEGDQLESLAQSSSPERVASRRSEDAA